MGHTGDYINNWITDNYRMMRRNLTLLFHEHLIWGSYIFLSYLTIESSIYFSWLKVSDDNTLDLMVTSEILGESKIPERNEY